MIVCSAIGSVVTENPEKGIRILDNQDIPATAVGAAADTAAINNSKT